MKSYMRFLIVTLILCCGAAALAGTREFKQDVELTNSQIDQARILLSKAIPTLTDFSHRVESTYLTGSREVYPNDFHKASIEIQMVADRIGTMKTELDILVEHPPQTAAAHRSAMELRKGIADLQNQALKGKVENNGSAVSNFVSKTYNEERLKIQDEYSGDERGAAATIAHNASLVKKRLSDSSRLADQLVQLTRPD